MNERTILKALVGSQAHGLANADSDHDYRGVFVVPTADLLRIEGHAKRTSSVEHDGATMPDDVAWEVGHFLHQAMKCNPTILEVMAAPVCEADQWGYELRALLPFVWNPKGVREAFVGYGMSQRKKMLDDREKWPWKFACAYLRTLAAGTHLLTTGEVLVDVRTHEVHPLLVRFKAGEASKGEVIDACDKWARRIDEALVGCSHEPDLERVNEYLLRLRRAHWESHTALTVLTYQHGDRVVIDGRTHALPPRDGEQATDSTPARSEG